MTSCKLFYKLFSCIRDEYELQTLDMDLCKIDKRIRVAHVKVICAAHLRGQLEVFVRY